MKKTVNLLCFLLTFLILAASFASCSGKKQDTPDVKPEQTTQKEEEETQEPNVLDGVKFDLETVNVLSWIPSNIIEYIKEDSVGSDAISHTVYLRHAYATDQLNIELFWKQIPGNNEGTNLTDYIQQARNSHNSGGQGSDIYCCYSNAAASMASEGFLADIGSHKYMDYSRPFWPTNLLSEMTVNNKLYFCTGDISTNLVFMTSMVFFNKNLINDYQINNTIETLYGEENIYGLVHDNRWTLDVMFTLCENVYGEMGDPDSNADDLYGFGTYKTLVDNFYYCTGNRVIDVENGLFNVSAAFTNTDSMSTLLAKVQTFLFDSGVAHYYGSDFAAARDAFATGKNLFSLAPASHAYSKHYKMENLKYGVLPVPMYDENCTSYSSVHSFPYSMYGVEYNSDRIEIAGAFLQCLGEYSYQQTRPAIFEQTMKGRYSNDEPDAEMWDIIIDTQTFDMGRVFAGMFGSNIQEQLTVTLFRNQLMSGSDDWQSVMASNKTIIQKYADRILAQLKKLP